MFLQLIGKKKKKKKLYENVYNNVSILYLNNLLLYGTEKKNVIWIGHNISLL